MVALQGVEMKSCPVLLPNVICSLLPLCCLSAAPMEMEMRMASKGSAVPIALIADATPRASEPLSTIPLPKLVDTLARNEEQIASLVNHEALLDRQVGRMRVWKLAIGLPACVQCTAHSRPCTAQAGPAAPAPAAHGELPHPWRTPHTLTPPPA